MEAFDDRICAKLNTIFWGPVLNQRVERRVGGKHCAAVASGSDDLFLRLSMLLMRHVRWAIARSELELVCRRKTMLLSNLFDPTRKQGGVRTFDDHAAVDEEFCSPPRLVIGLVAKHDVH